METNQILQADVLDIIFERRNKLYGAYDLRKTYNKRLKTAIAVMISSCLFAFLITVAAKNNTHQHAALIVDGDVSLRKLDPPSQPVIPPPLPPPAPKQIATIKFTTPILTNKPIETPPPLQSDIDKISISIVDNPKGEDKDVIAPPVEKSTGNVVAPQVNEFNGEVFHVQIEARFPGGTDAWKRFLERNLKADVPSNNGAPAGAYSVIVSFLVDKEGNVSEVQALNDPGFGTATEAVRAIQIGPKWIPAVQNGRNVIYRQRQVITFKVEEGQ